jgi:hypothetical protein
MPQQALDRRRQRRHTATANPLYPNACRRTHCTSNFWEPAAQGCQVVSPSSVCIKYKCATQQVAWALTRRRQSSDGADLSWCRSLLPRATASAFAGGRFSRPPRPTGAKLGLRPARLTERGRHSGPQAAPRPRGRPASKAGPCPQPPGLPQTIDSPVCYGVRLQAFSPPPREP